MTSSLNSLTAGRKTLLKTIAIAALAALFWWLLPSEESAPRGVGDSSPEPAESDSRTADFSERERTQPAISEAPADSTESLLAALTGGLPLDESFIDDLRVVIDPSAGYPERGGAVRALGDSLSGPEVEALYRFLLAGPPEGNRARNYDRAVKNDVLNRLRQQAAPPEGLTETMIAMFEDRNQDGAVRDYALQHLRAWHRKAPADERSAILETLVQGLEETRSSMGGTSLISLRNLEDHEEGNAGVDVIRSALEVAHDEQAGDLSRVTAMQISAERSPSEVRALAAEWALDPNAGYPRRLSAIAALGGSASAESAAVLAELEDLGDPHLSPALDAAFRKLRDAGIEIEKIEDHR